MPLGKSKSLRLYLSSSLKGGKTSPSILESLSIEQSVFEGSYYLSRSARVLLGVVLFLDVFMQECEIS